MRAVAGDSPGRSRPKQQQKTGVCLSVCEKIVVTVALVAKLQSDSGEEAEKNVPRMPWFHFFYLRVRNEAIKQPRKRLAIERAGKGLLPLLVSVSGSSFTPHTALFSSMRNTP